MSLVSFSLDPKFPASLCSLLASTTSVMGKEGSQAHEPHPEGDGPGPAIAVWVNLGGDAHLMVIGYAVHVVLRLVGPGGPSAYGPSCRHLGVWVRGEP